MSPAIVAAIKKAAVAVLTDRKMLKTLCGIILGIIIIIFIPIFTLLAVFSITQDLELSTIGQLVMGQLDQEEKNKINHVDTTMNDIQSAMISRGFSRLRVSEAQILFNLGLYDKSYSSGFVNKLAGCFQSGQTDAQLISAVNSAFGVNLSVTEFTNMMTPIRAVYIDSSNYVDPTSKNNIDLVQWAMYAKDKRWGYVWGTYGKVLDEALLESKIAQYPNNVGIYEEFIRNNWLDKRTVDCIGLIKGYCWFDPVTGNVNYAVNGMPDIDSDYMYNSNAEKGTIDTMPDIPGLAVWYSGHIGIYTGDGTVLEASGTKVGVIETELVSGAWTHWIKIPYIHYIEETEDPVYPDEPEPPEPIEPDEPVPPDPGEPVPPDPGEP